MIGYTITSGTPTLQERAALEDALSKHERKDTAVKVVKSVWARPQLRAPLARKA